MADVNALIAQGGNVLGKFGQAADIRSANTRNELLQLGIQSEPARQARLQAQEGRAATTFEQEQTQVIRGQLFQGANDYVNAIESGNREAALAAISALPDEGQLGEIKNNALVALNSPDPEDDVAVLEQARAIRQSGIDEGFFKGQDKELGSAAMQDFRAVKNMSPEDRALWFQNKRAVKTLLVGGVPHVMVGSEAFPVNSSEGQATLQGEVDAKKAIAKAGEEGKQEAQIEAIAPKAEETRVQEAITDAPERIERAESRIELAGLATRDIDDALDKIGFFTTGITGWIAAIKPDTDRRDLDSLYETLRSRLGIEELGQMREQSKDGSSGFGQLNELELRGIQSARTALDANLSAPQQIRNLNILRRHVQRQNAVAVNIANVAEGLLTEEQGQRQVRRDWLEIDLAAGYNDETGEFEQSGNTQTINDTTFTIRKKQ